MVVVIHMSASHKIILYDESYGMLKDYAKDKFHEDTLGQNCTNIYNFSVCTCENPRSRPTCTRHHTLLCLCQPLPRIMHHSPESTLGYGIFAWYFAKYRTDSGTACDQGRIWTQATPGTARRDPRRYAMQCDLNKISMRRNSKFYVSGPRKER